MLLRSSDIILINVHIIPDMVPGGTQINVPVQKSMCHIRAVLHSMLIEKEHLPCSAKFTHRFKPKIESTQSEKKSSSTLLC